MEQTILDTQQDNVESVSLFIMELKQEKDEDEDEDDAPLIDKSSYLYCILLENEVLDNGNHDNLSSAPMLVAKWLSTATFDAVAKQCYKPLQH
eukprot:3243745-Ditylum_brightwellii.AAC.1